MSKKPFIFIGILCLFLIATGCVAYFRIKQYRTVEVERRQSSTEPQNAYTDIYSTAPRQSIDIDQYIGDTNLEPQQSHISIETPRQTPTGQGGQSQQTAPPQKQPVEPAPSSASTLNAGQKEEIRIAANTFMTSYDKFHAATRGMAPILGMTASTTPVSQNASQLDPYVAQYKNMAAALKKQVSEAPPSIARELSLMAGNMDEAANALENIRLDAAAGTFRMGPSMTFSNASISMVKNMMFFAEKIRELAIPVTENDPIYRLIMMTGSL